MRELLTKGEGLFRPSVIKKAAAIFLLIPLMVIGSISMAQAADYGHTPIGMIAATQMVDPLSPNARVTDYMFLPTPVYQTPFDVPRLDYNPLATFIRKPEMILGESEDLQASSRIPTLNGIITSAFGYRKHPIKGKVRHHNGIDLAAKLGTPVLAPADGRVVFSGVRKGYGNVVEIDHENGYRTLLAHNSRLLVRAGDIVRSGMEIAKAGSTGWSTGVHVHVEIRKDGKLINPIGYLVSAK